MDEQELPLSSRNAVVAAEELLLAPPSCRRPLSAPGHQLPELSWTSPDPSLIAGLWATYVPDSQQLRRVHA